MFLYNLRLAIKSIRRNLSLSVLMVAAIGIGIGACMTVVTVYYMMSGDPIPHKSDRLFAVQLNNWEAPGPFDQDRPERLPELLTYQDAMNLMESDIPTRKLAMHASGLTLDPANPDINPMLTTTLFTTTDFFAMFDLPFQYGGAWDESADSSAAEVAVISRSLNETVFGGENSVGERISLDNREFLIIGVLDHWEPVPRFYSAHNNAFGETDDAFIPLSVNATWEKQNFGNTNCWGDSPIDSYAAFLGSECVWIEYWVELDTAAQQDRYLSYLAAYISEQKRLGRFPIADASAEIHDVNDWLVYNEVVNPDFRVLLGLAIMFLVVCLINTVALLLAKFSANAPRVGLRRALGASKATIFKQNLVEVGLIGLGGGMLGLLLAWLGLQGVKAVNLGQYDQLVRMDQTLVIAALLVSVVAALIAGLYPTWRICQVPPATYLKTQ